MPVITSPWYTTELILAHPDWRFLFGDNTRRAGRKGQSVVCRGHANCVGVRTKWLPNMRPAAFFYDNDYDRCAAMIKEDIAPVLAHVKAGGTAVLPLGGLGTGFAGLEQHAPSLFHYLKAELEILVEAGEAQPLPPPHKITAPKAWEIQDHMRTANIMMIWTVYKGTPEFPKDYVAVPTTSACLAPLREVLVDHRLPHLRERMPRGMQRLPPMPEDGPNIVETWV